MEELNHVAIMGEILAVDVATGQELAEMIENSGEGSPARSPEEWINERVF